MNVEDSVYLGTVCSEHMPEDVKIFVVFHFKHVHASG